MSYTRRFDQTGGTFIEDLTIGKYNLDNGPIIFGLTILPYAGTGTAAISVNRFVGRNIGGIKEIELWGQLTPGAGDFEAGMTIDFSLFSDEDFYQPTFPLSTPVGIAELQIATNNLANNSSDSAIIISNAISDKTIDVVFRRLDNTPTPPGVPSNAFSAVIQNWYVKIISN